MILWVISKPDTSLKVPFFNTDDTTNYHHHYKSLLNKSNFHNYGHINMRTSLDEIISRKSLISTIQRRTYSFKTLHIIFSQYPYILCESSNSANYNLLGVGKAVIFLIFFHSLLEQENNLDIFWDMDNAKYNISLKQKEMLVLIIVMHKRFRFNTKYCPRQILFPLKEIKKIELHDCL